MSATFTKEDLRDHLCPLQEDEDWTPNTVPDLATFALAQIEAREKAEAERDEAMVAVAFADEYFANARTAWKNDTLAATEKIIGNRELRTWMNLPAVLRTRERAGVTP